MFVSLSFSFFLSEPVAISVVCRPTGNERGHQARDQRRAVEEHVERVGHQAQAVGPDAVGQLHKGKRQVDAEEVKDVSRLGLLEDRTE